MRPAGGKIEVGASSPRGNLAPSKPTDRSGRRAGARPPGDYLYVIAGADRRIRLGCCRNPKARLAICDTGSSAPPTLAYVVAVQDGFAIKQLARALLSPHGHRDGWFDCTPEAAVQAIHTAACELDVPVTGDDGEPIVESVETPGWERLAIVTTLWVVGIVLIGTDALITLR